MCFYSFQQMSFVNTTLSKSRTSTGIPPSLSAFMRSFIAPKLKKSHWHHGCGLTPCWMQFVVNTQKVVAITYRAFIASETIFDSRAVLQYFKSSFLKWDLESCICLDCEIQSESHITELLEESIAVWEKTGRLFLIQWGIHENIGSHLYVQKSNLVATWLIFGEKKFKSIYYCIYQCVNVLIGSTQLGTSHIIIHYVFLSSTSFDAIHPYQSCGIS